MDGCKHRSLTTLPKFLVHNDILMGETLAFQLEQYTLEGTNNKPGFPIVAAFPREKQAGACFLDGGRIEYLYCPGKECHGHTVGMASLAEVFGLCVYLV
jgi:hypothetical protein